MWRLCKQRKLFLLFLKFDTHTEASLRDAFADDMLGGEMAEHGLHHLRVLQVVDEHVETSHYTHHVSVELGAVGVGDVDPIEESLSAGRHFEEPA